MYFVEYNEPLYAKREAAEAEERRRRELHVNGATGLESVWIAVHDLPAAAARYRTAGLVPGPEFRLGVLDTQAREISTPGGTLLLVQAKPGLQSDPDAEGAFVGISIRTRNLDTVRAVVSETHALDLKPYQGRYGRSILVPSDLARGTLIEFFE